MGDLERTHFPPSAVYSFHGWFAKARYAMLASDMQPLIAPVLLTSAGDISSAGFVHCVAFVTVL